MNRIFLFLIIIAVIVAIAVFLLVSFLLRPSGAEAPGPGDDTTTGQEGAPAGSPYQIDGVVVFLNPDPSKLVSLAPQTSPPEGAQPTQPSPLPTLVATASPQPQPQPTIPPPAPTAAPPGGGASVTFISYVVQPGDNLYRITQKQNTSIELMAAHGISSVDMVPGKTLNLPIANSNYCAGRQAYVVRPGDTVFSIAQRYNTTIAAIQQANNLGPDYRIYITQVLCIP